MGGNTIRGRSRFCLSAPFWNLQWKYGEVAWLHCETFRGGSGRPFKRGKRQISLSSLSSHGARFRENRLKRGEWDGPAILPNWNGFRWQCCSLQICPDFYGVKCDRPINGFCPAELALISVICRERCIQSPSKELFPISMNVRLKCSAAHVFWSLQRNISAGT